MNRIDDEMLLRHLRGHLTADERGHVVAALRSNPALALRMRDLQAVADWGGRVRQAGFGPHFAARASALAADARVDSFAAALGRAFMGVAGAGALAAVLIAAWNVAEYNNAQRNALEAAIGLPPDNLDTAFLYQSESPQ